MSSSRARAAMIPFALSLSLALAAPVGATDETEDSVEKLNPVKFWDYAGCISALAAADTPAGMIAAFHQCGRVITLYWNEE